MEKSLKIYTFVDGVKDTPFPDLANQVEAFDFTYSTSRMNVIPQLSASVMFKRCLDSEWNGEQYILFNGERYFIKQTPSSSKDNTDARWKHDITFVSERNILSGIYFYDVVTSNVGSDKYVSNSSNVLFFGDIHEFASRLNYSLQYSGVDYSVVIDDGISSEAMQVAFEDKFVSDAIQEIYNIFDLPYYFVGKVCHIGYTSNAITTVLKYGDKDALLSIQKTNANYKIVNSCTGIGSTDNIPFYYPNPSNDRAAIEAAGGKWITPSANLMPPIYRTSLGAERFYPAKNNTYTDPETGLKYIFENTYTTKNPHQHKVLFESIKPSIKGMMNGQPTPKDMDKFLQFAYDTNDNDELDEDNNFKHPYFFAKLPIYNGTFGFNLFDQAIVGQDMSMSMTSGNCGACNFVIGVDADTQKNVVQVNENGTLKRDEDGNVVTVGSPQPIQNDTTKYETWISLKKDDSAFGILMPNAGGNYKPSTNDTFVIIGIDMPQSYIAAAEDRLYKEIIKYMFFNNAEKFTFAINFSRIYLAENPLVYNQLNENARIRIEYNGKEENLYISDYTYKVSKSEALPDITVTLSDTLTVRKGTLQTSIDSVKQEIMSSVGSSDFYKQGLKYFVRKDVPDYAVKITAREAFDVGSYAPNISGGTFRRNADGTTFMEVDKLLVRIKAYFEQLEVVSTRYSGGNNIYSSAAMNCTKVEDKGTYYRCYFLSEQDGTEVKNRFVVGDQVRCQEFDLIKKNGAAVTNRSYWRLVTDIGSDYIDISKTDAMTGSDIPLAGDDIVQFGNRTEKDRQNLIIQYTVGVNAPLYSMLQGVNSYSLEGKDILQQGFDASTGKAFQRIYGESYIGARDLSQFMKYTPEGGLEIKGKITSVGGDGITGNLDKIKEEITAIKTESDLFAESVTKNFEDIQDQIDGAIETWFEDPAPTLTNKPAKDWTTPAIKNTHLGDLYYSGEGKAYRFQMNGVAYEWKVLSDSDITLALANAKKAQDTADGKRRVYIRQPLNAEAYDVGDLWTNATFGTTYSNDLLRCKTAKEAGIAFSISHWELASKYTDDTAAKAAAAAAAAAASAANSAQVDANAAQAAASGAAALLADMANDNKLTPQEKQYTKQEWDVIVSEKPKNDIAADKYGVSKTAYNTAYTALGTYITPLLVSLSTTSDVVGTTFRSTFKAYYDAKTDLLNAISAKAKDIADAAQTKANKAETDASNAQAAADAAKTAAANAKTAADAADKKAVSANGLLADIASDSKLTAVEKQQTKKEWDTIISEKPLNNANAVKFGLSTAAYDTAYNTLNTYITPLLVSLTTTSDIVGTTFRTNFKLYYDARTNLLNAISEKAKILADSAQAKANAAANAASAAQTDADAAANAASAAQTTAADALAKANGANALLADIASDNKLTATEKQATKKEWTIIVSEKPLNNANAVKFGVSTATYDTNYAALNTYITPLLASLTTTSDIVGATFRDKFKLYYDSRTNLLNAISVRAKELADAAQESIDNLEIGGRNLLEKSDVEKTSANEYLNYANTTSCFDKYGIGEYTISFDLKVAKNGRVLVYSTPDILEKFKYIFTDFYVNATTEYQRFSSVVKIRISNAESILSFLSFFGTYNTGVIPTVKNVKIEQGNRATSWTPAPEEVAQDITDVGAAAEAADAKAKAAGDRLNNWASDATVSPSEKLSLKQEAKALAAEKDAIVSDAAKYSVSSAAYVTAYTAYSNELTYHSTATPENITIRAAFATSQTAYYAQQKAILNAIVVAAKKIADDAMTTANKGVADAKTAQTTATTANTAVTAIKNFTDVAFADGVIDRGEAAAIEKYKNTVNESQKSIQGGYTTLYANGYLAGTAKTGLKTAYDAVAVSITALLTAINTAIADKKTTDAEKLAVDTAYATFSTKMNLYYAAVETANKSIQDVLKKYSDDALAAIPDLSYLTTALNGNTTTQGGLILTNLISLGTGKGAAFIPKSGLNGIYNSAKTGGGIAFWVGGAMKDRADYTTATMPTDVAKGIDRFDGSGYRANGNMSWNAAGELTVSTQFFKVISSTGITKLEYSNVRDTLDFNANLLFKTGITLKFEADATDYIAYLKWLKSVFENDPANDAIKVNKSLYSIKEISAYGDGTGGGGGGGGIIQTVYPYSAISAVYVDTNLTDTFNAYTISKLASRIKIIEDSGTAWADITGKPTTFTPSAHVHPLSEISDLHANWDAILKLTPTAQITRWAAWSEVTAKPAWIGATKPTYSYSEITGTPPAVDLSSYVTLNTTQNITGTKTLSGNTILHSANYNNYAPTKTGGGASGTWGIVSNRTNGLELSYAPLANSNYGTYGGIIQGNGINMGMPDGRWYNKIKILHNNSAGYYTELAQNFTGANNLYYRKMENGTLGGWTTVIDSGNYTQILDGRYVNKAGDTMTGLLSVPVILANKVNGAGIVINKLGDNYAGIGYSGLSNVVYYSKCDVNGTWVGLNELHHEFQGTNNVANFYSSTVSSYVYFKNNTQNNIASVGHYDGMASVCNEKTVYRIGVLDDGTPAFRMGSAASSPTYDLWHTGNDGSDSGLDADLLDGVHYQNILERSHSGIGNSGTATGWFRIASTYDNNAVGSAFTLHLTRSYYHTNTESYIFDINVVYNGNTTIVQTSGYANDRLIDQIRVTSNNNSGVCYIDFHIARSTTDNLYRWTTIGSAVSQTAWTVNPTALAITTVFYTDNGVKCDKGFVGTFYGNANSSTKLQTARSIFGQPFDGTGNVAGQGLFYGTGASYEGGALQIRENNLVGAGNGTWAEAPSIGFHWGGRVGASIKLLTNASFYFANIDGNGATSIEVKGLKTNNICIETTNAGVYGNTSEINTIAGHLHLQHHSGSVGIGGISPLYKLDVNGDIYARGFLYSSSSGLEVMIGSQNNAYCHYNTTAPIHWFNKSVEIQGTLNPYGGAHEFGSSAARWGTLWANSGQFSGLLRVDVYISAGESADDAYGFINVCRAAGVNNAAAFSWVRSGTMAFAIGCNTSNQIVLGQGAGGVNKTINPWFTLSGAGATLASVSCSGRSTFAGLISSDWLRTTGGVGWYSETYGGGIYMIDTTYVQVYANKAFLVNNTSHYAINNQGGYYSALNSNHSDTWANALNVQYAVFNVANSMYVPAYTYQNIIGWDSVITNSGYHTRYSIGSKRSSAGFGAMAFTIGNSDAGNSGNQLALYGGGTMEWTGSIVAQGEITAYSDIRLKSDITNLSFRGRLSPKTYIKDDKKSIGFIAQEVQQLYPELIHIGSDENHYLSLNYGSITAILSAQINSIDDEVTILKREIKELKQEIINLKNK